MIERILIPLDGSTEAEVAVGAAMPLVRAGGSEVILLHVLREPGSADPIRPYLERAVEALKKLGIDATYGVRVGVPAEQILSYAATSGAGLISISTHGRSGMRRLLMGSVAESVMRRADVPLLVSRPGIAATEWKRIVVALDGSTRAEQVLHDAAWIAKAVGGTLDVLRVTMPIVTHGGPGEFPVYFEPEDAMPYLQGVCDRLVQEGAPARPVARVGRAPSEIVTEALDIGAGLICMTTHGRSGLTRVLLGSVAEEVLRTAPCPVLVRRMVKEPVGAR